MGNSNKKVIKIKESYKNENKVKKYLFHDETHSGEIINRKESEEIILTTHAYEKYCYK